ncbi:transposon Ty3-I Gag-Pol polyprotein [Trichonephila clavipes]|nr:transposon Ty3-I Gag-Pol polyprotein [Trichonephila clavipes]
MSKKTSDHERKYTSFELEVLAVVEALKKFRIYVLGTSFKIITDCDALVKTLSKKELNPPTAQNGFFRPTREASKMDCTDFSAFNLENLCKEQPPAPGNRSKERRYRGKDLATTGEKKFGTGEKREGDEKSRGREK